MHADILDQKESLQPFTGAFLLHAAVIMGWLCTDRRHRESLAIPMPEAGVGIEQ
jgi:hypothetical protein